MKKASPLAGGLSVGIVVGLTVFFATLASAISGGGYAFLALIGSIYPWYSVSIAGSIIGLIFGVIDGFILGFLVVWFYNRFNK
jgi:O-antigen ligase